MTISKDLAQGEKITVDYHLSNVGKLPYFSITASLHRNGHYEGGGCLHDDIEAAFPGQFTDLIALHLSDVRGVPMHAEANGWYYFIGGAGGHASLQKHLRLTAEELQALVTRLYALPDTGARRLAFYDFVEAQRPRWRAEAEAAIANHKLELA